MEITSWIITTLAISTLHAICTWKLYVKAGRKAWEAFIPVYNGIVLMQIINRPKWWIFLLFLPVINLLILPVIWIETLRTFGKKTTADMWLGVISFGIYIGYVNYTQDVSYEAKRDTKPATKALDTLGSLTFALIVATFVHTYFIQPFVIPTSSLEKTLLVGDFLFVSKFHYGARTPMTPIAAPMVHDSIPLVKSKSYVSKPQLPYFRFPALQNIERNDIVVFNWPIDTVRMFRENSFEKQYKPIDKKSNYVKRCVGIPGDNIEIKNSDLYVNGKLVSLPSRSKVQFSYKVKFKKDAQFDINQLLQDLSSTDSYLIDADTTYIINSLTNDNVAKLKNSGLVEKIEKNLSVNDKDKDYILTIDTSKDCSDVENALNNLYQNRGGVKYNKDEGRAVVYRINNEILNAFKQFKSVKKAEPIYEIFPNSKEYANWNVDNMGSVKIPQAGQTVSLDLKTLPFYKMVISDYENHKLEVIGNTIKIDGKVATSYTFEKDYYWMMGDNRHNSEDSRYWGFVPADHIVGKPIFIWMSFDIDNVFHKNFLDRFRTERFFTTVSGEGEPQSYFKYFLILLGAYFVWDWYKGKQKKKEADLL
ncbi:signal peptidase I [Flavobacterium difficile]|uniref:Signal peptidase I n=1 Tax=Flavobacterium difficile TaxID=2709659 RepID=A0ABX0I778_9FLAO|nr:signal peptidase I [Flavobacterium difficile]NHM02991.1 signal peptidase I [Flavobacterium difficile]